MAKWHMKNKMTLALIAVIRKILIYYNCTPRCVQLLIHLAIYKMTFSSIFLSTFIKALYINIHFVVVL